MSTLQTTNLKNPSSASNNIVLDASGNVAIPAGTAAAPAVYPTGDSNTGLFSPGADSVAISTGGTQRATVDASGRVLVGGTSSRDTGASVARQIQTEDTANTAGISIIRNTNDNGGGVVALAKSRGTTLGSNTVVQTNDLLGTIIFNGADGTAINTSAASIRAEVDAAPSTGIIPGRLRFFTTNTSGTGTEALRINSAQKMGFGSGIQDGGVYSTAYLTAYTNATAAASSVGAEFYGPSTSTRYHISFSNPNGLVGSISTNASATTYSTSSDYRLKENVTPLTGAAARVQQLKPSRFNFIADPDTEVDGFIAHEVQEIVPEAITGTKDEVDEDGKPLYQGIDQSKLVPLLTAALQEALGKIADLETRLAALESK